MAESELSEFVVTPRPNGPIGPERNRVCTTVLDVDHAIDRDTYKHLPILTGAIAKVPVPDVSPAIELALLGDSEHGADLPLMKQRSNGSNVRKRLHTTDRRIA